MSNRIEFNCYDCPEDEMEVTYYDKNFRFFSLDTNSNESIAESTVVLKEQDAVNLAIFIIKRANVDKKLLNALYGAL